MARGVLVKFGNTMLSSKYETRLLLGMRMQGYHSPVDKGMNRQFLMTSRDVSCHNVMIFLDSPVDSTASVTVYAIKSGKQRSNDYGSNPFEKLQKQP